MVNLKNYCPKLYEEENIFYVCKLSLFFSPNMLLMITKLSLFTLLHAFDGQGWVKSSSWIKGGIVRSSGVK